MTYKLGCNETVGALFARVKLDNWIKRFGRKLTNVVMSEGRKNYTLSLNLINSIPLWTCDKFIEMYRLYTTYK